MEERQLAAPARINRSFGNAAGARDRFDRRVGVTIGQKCGGARPGATWVPGSVPKSPDVIVVTQGGNTEYHVCGDLTLSGTGYLTGSTPATDSIIVIENGSLNIAVFASSGDLDFYWQDSAGDFLEETVATTVN